MGKNSLCPSLEGGRASPSFILTKNEWAHVTIKSPVCLDSSDPHEVAIAQAMVAGTQGIEKTRLHDRAVYVAYMPLKEADWSIALVIPQANIESQLHLFRRTGWG